MWLLSRKCITIYFTKVKLCEISLSSTIYDFSVDHSPIEKEDILDFHEYLIKIII